MLQHQLSLKLNKCTGCAAIRLLSLIVALVKKPLYQKLHLQWTHSRWLCRTLLSEQRAHCRAASDVFRVLKGTTQWQVLRRLSSASQLSMLAQTGESHSSPRHSSPSQIHDLVCRMPCCSKRCTSTVIDTPLPHVLTLQ